MHESGVPASIVLAVAMHESANGNSHIAKKLNNQFGVKGYDTHVFITITIKSNILPTKNMIR